MEKKAEAEVYVKPLKSMETFLPLVALYLFQSF